ncbi:hypothetical protein LTR53_004107 [Teratosphaeriaceae sp. CCFEE 6253]|nr:hypothetical protein LTR53_004107 [Teratosphaeriaceae sp. CCFEE 6253]
MKPYTYRNLDPQRQEFRLLIVLPDKSDGPLRLIIKHASLAEDQRSAYETVSYTWGNSTRSARLIIQEHRLALLRRHLYVPANTESALKQVRFSDRSRIIWIDAVCINQDDTKERSQQVGMMGRIYGSSIGNLVCLGDLDEVMAGRVSHTLDDLLDDARRKTDGFSNFFSTVLDEETGEYGLSDCGLDVVAPLDVLDLVLGRPWWQRLWVLQEAVLSPNNTVLLGPLRLDLIHLTRAIVWWNYHYRSLTDNPLGPLSQDAVPGLPCLVQLFFLLDKELCYRSDSSRDHDFSIDALLRCAYGLRKSEGRDGVFAVLALVKNSFHTPLPVMVPDYSRPLSDVLQEATRRTLVERGDLASLCALSLRAGDPEEDAGVASWATRVDRHNDFLVDPSSLPFAYDPYGLQQRDEWDRTHPVPADPGILAVRGYVLDSVDKVTQTYQEHVTEDQLREAVSMYASAAASHGCSPDLSAVARTLVGDLTRQRTRISQAAASHSSLPDEHGCDHYLAPLERFLEALWTDQTSDVHAAFSEIAPAYNFINMGCRRFFTTTSGRPGLGPQVMRPGDVVAALRGADKLCILRPLTTGRFRFVGAGYVDGKMDGEGVQECVGWGQEEVDIELV